MYDPVLARMYVAIGEPGVISVIDSQALELIETVPTEDGAHTIAVDTDSHVVYAFLPGSGGVGVYGDT